MEKVELKYIFKEEKELCTIFKNINKQVLERLWRKGNPSALLVGMQTGEDAVENSMEFPQETKNGTAF